MEPFVTLGLVLLQEVINGLKHMCTPILEMQKLRCPSESATLIGVRCDFFRHIFVEGKIDRAVVSSL